MTLQQKKRGCSEQVLRLGLIRRYEPMYTYPRLDDFLMGKRFSSRWRPQLARALSCKSQLWPTLARGPFVYWVYHLAQLLEASKLYVAEGKKSKGDGGKR